MTSATMTPTFRGLGNLNPDGSNGFSGITHLFTSGHTGPHHEHEIWSNSQRSSPKQRSIAI
jgi:hypothetical protein